MQLAPNPSGANGPRPGRTHGRLRNTAGNAASKAYPTEVTRRTRLDLPPAVRGKQPGLAPPKGPKATPQASIAKVAELRKTRRAPKPERGLTSSSVAEGVLTGAASFLNLLAARAATEPLVDTPVAPAEARDYVALGRRMAVGMGWSGRQWAALYELWRRESGWNPQAVNEGSGAAGIPQMLPKAHPGIDIDAFLADPRWQIRWGLQYIAQRYGDPVAALQHSNQFGWY